MNGVLGVMLDCSRNSVLKPQKVKEFAEVIAKMGYNMLQLYTEDTYEIKEEPYFGCMRGRYSAEEIKDIEAHCNSLGIELVPCVQVLAHLNGVKYWDNYKEIFDCNDILLVDDERTYALIEKMIKTCAENFSSRNINIGMDEAHMVGLGKYLDLHGYKDRFELLERHLNKVLSICEKYGFKPMMWSDMFFKLAGKTEYFTGEFDFPKEITEKVPKSVNLVYWDYYHVEKREYAAMLKNHKQLSENIWFAGSVWTSAGFSPKNYYALYSALPAMEACKEFGVDNILMTAWGNNGSECSFFAVLPALAVIADYYKTGEQNIERVKEAFNKITGESFEDFMLLDDTGRYEKDIKAVRTIDKYALYNDALYGTFDSAIPDGLDEYYKELSVRLKGAAARSKNYKYLFEHASELANVLSLKSELSKKTKALYDNKDIKGIKRLVKVTYKDLINRLKEFKAAFGKYWFNEKKPYGFEVQDVRIGGLIERLNTCAERLTAFANGKLESLPELEEYRQAIEGRYEKGKTVLFNNWGETVSVNIIN